MAFTHECILNKNTPEIREKLESLGIRYKYAFNVGSDSVIKCRNGFYNTYQSKYYQSLKDMFTKATNCGTNEELFLAIAALRDDSDLHQWFTDGGDLVVKCLFDSLPERHQKLHKATVKELIECFNKVEIMKEVNK